MKFINIVSLFLISWVLGTSAHSQVGNVEISKDMLQVEAAVLSFNLLERDVSGIQFEVRYPNGMRIMDLGACLDGVPESHQKTFTTCKNFPEKNTLLVVISDIGMSRELTPGLLGFANIGGASNNFGALEVANVVALDTQGNKIKGDAAAFIELQID